MKILDNPKISIVIVNYNGEKYLRRTLSAFLSLTYTNKEIIVVDNGSTDGSREYIKTLKDIKLIESPKLREKNFACNLWVKNASGEYILMCDNDLLVTQNDLLEDIIAMYQEKKDTWILWISFTNEWEKYTKWYWNFLWYYYTKEKKSVKIDKVLNYNWCEISFPSWIWFFIKKDIWNELGWYDDFLKFWWDDSDIWIKSLLFWYKNYLYSKSVQVHIWMSERADNKKFQLKFWEMFFADMYTITKNFTFKNILLIIPIYSFYYFLRAIKQSIFRFSIWPFFAYFYWYYLFIKNLNIALKKRKNIQEKRIIKKDVFLSIKNLW